MRREGLGAEPHRRHNPLTDQWILVSAGRDQRPWLGQEEPAPREMPPAHQPDCHLCPGNQRANGLINPHYTSTFVFDNDFAALRPNTSTVRLQEGLFLSEGVAGRCRVVCFTPRHDLSLGLLSLFDLRLVIDLWAQQSEELGLRFPWVQVFENRGEAMGASNPHPHGQIWAVSVVPTEGVKELATQQHHHQTTGHSLLLDYVDQEQAGDRLVEADEHWLVVVPFWAAWPFETLIIARHPVRRLPELENEARDSLARVLIRLFGRYDNLFRSPFPYSMGWHQAPFDSGECEGWQLHAHVFPPLLRSATVRKFMVGFELLAEVQRDLTPEEAASKLRATSPVHHRLAARD